MDQRQHGVIAIRARQLPQPACLLLAQFMAEMEREAATARLSSK